MDQRTLPPPFYNRNSGKKNMQKKSIQVKISTPTDKVLTKEQKRFNRLVDSIKHCRKSIETMMEDDIWLRQEGEKQVKPVEERNQDANFNLVQALHNHPLKKQLNKKETEKLNQIMLEELNSLITTHKYSTDESVQSMYAHYEGSGKTFEQLKEEELAEEKESASQFFQQMFGIDLDPDDFNDPEKAQAKFRDFAEAKQAQEEAKAARKAARKKTPRQIEAEQRKAEATSVINKSVKQIYHDLIKHYHPDREPDEAKRLEKTEIMKQITAAYEANDHIQLLELQLNLLSGRLNVYQEFTEVQLRYFNNALQEQLQQLNQQLESVHPGNTGNPYAMLFSYTRTLSEQRIKSYIKDLLRGQKQMENTANSIGTIGSLRSFIKNYELPDDDFGNFFQMLDMMMPRR
jgi:hypothetical protein